MYFTLSDDEDDNSLLVTSDTLDMDESLSEVEIRDVEDGEGSVVCLHYQSTFRQGFADNHFHGCPLDPSLHYGLRYALYRPLKLFYRSTSSLNVNQVVSQVSELVQGSHYVGTHGHMFQDVLLPIRVFHFPMGDPDCEYATWNEARQLLIRWLFMKPMTILFNQDIKMELVQTLFRTRVRKVSVDGLLRKPSPTPVQGSGGMMPYPGSAHESDVLRRRNAKRQNENAAWTCTTDVTSIPI